MDFGSFLIVLMLVGLASYQLRTEFQNEMEQQQLRDEFEFEKLKLEQKNLNLTLELMRREAENQNLRITYLGMSMEHCKKEQNKEFDLGLGDTFWTVTESIKKQYNAWISYITKKIK